MFTDDNGVRRETREELTIEQKLDLILEEVKQLKRAFPKDEDGESDFEGHRRAHEQLITAAKAQTKFWEELRLDVIKKGLWGMLIIICGLVITGVGTKLGIK